MAAGPRAQKPFPLPRAFLIGTVTSGVAVAGFTDDWACSALGAAIVGGLASMVVARLADGRVGRPRRTAWIWTAAVAFAVGQWAYTEWTYPREAWVGVFGRVPTGPLPERVDVRRYYAGGPGDRLTFMRFTAPSPATVAEWVSAMPPSDDDPLENYRDGTITWPQFWQSFSSFAADHGLPGWKDVPPMRDPRGYTATVMPGPEGGPIRSRTILWDAATGETFIVFSEG